MEENGECKHQNGFNQNCRPHYVMDSAAINRIVLNLSLCLQQRKQLGEEEGTGWLVESMDTIAPLIQATNLVHMKMLQPNTIHSVSLQHLHMHKVRGFTERIRRHTRK